MKNLRLRILPLVLLPLVFLNACRKKQDDVQIAPQLDLAPELQKNNLEGLPSAIYQQTASSPIHWQPWTKDIPEQARKANRMIFAVLGMPQAPGTINVLDTLASQPTIVEAINRNYLPVLIDCDASRELSMVAAELSAEINQNVNLPFFIWMSPDANPVAWIPAPWSDATTCREQFLNSHTLVTSMWDESPEYVKTNSAQDNENRAARLTQFRSMIEWSDTPAVDTLETLRAFLALYDPLSRNIAQLGGLAPSGAIDLLAVASMHPGLPEAVTLRARESCSDFLDELLQSAMFDPLDGGLFSARRGPSWSVPAFHRNSITQSRAAWALFRASMAIHHPLALERALALIEFNELTYQTPDDLFAIGIAPMHAPEAWMWTTREIEELLGPEDAAWWIKLTGMRALGNVPYEIDPDRRYFRQNTIALRGSIAELAAADGTDVETFRKRLDDVRGKLSAQREARFGTVTRDACAHAGASFRMASAYTSAFVATGDPVWRDKAVALLTKSQEAFRKGTGLRTFAQDGPLPVIDARASTYLLAIQAILDVVDVTSDASWLVWCDELATYLTETFAHDGYLYEASEDAAVLDLPITDLLMLFEDSSFGIMASAEQRLRNHQRPIIRELAELAASLPRQAINNPVLHSDLVQAGISRHVSAIVIHGPETSESLRSAIQRLPLRTIHRRTATPADGLPPGGCLVILNDAEPIAVDSTARLENILLP